MRNYDLSTKAKDMRMRRLARSQLIGAPLFSAQLGAHELRQLLNTGKTNILDNIQPHTVGTAAEFQKALGLASPLSVIKFVNKPAFEKILEGLLQHADDLDYVQELVTSLGKKTEINPSMNAVVEAFMRKRFTGRFKREGQSVKLDTLLHSSSKTVNDTDEEVRKKQTEFKSSNLCYFFQNGSCQYANCRFQHACGICNSNAHGSNSCMISHKNLPYRNRRADIMKERPSHKLFRGNGVPKVDRPPHPRYRRNRARD